MLGFALCLEEISFVCFNPRSSVFSHFKTEKKSSQFMILFKLIVRSFYTFSHLSDEDALISFGDLRIGLNKDLIWFLHNHPHRLKKITCYRQHM
jgi:hypothetical protein